MATANYTTRWTQQRGSRAVRIANCSGYKGLVPLHQAYAPFPD